MTPLTSEYALEVTDHPRIEALAAYFAAQIRAFQPEGACIIAGYCAGGLTAADSTRRNSRLLA